MSEPARIVLFGSNGQLGARLLTSLTDMGYEVTAIDRTRCDFSTATAKDIATIIRAVEPAVVINAAAYTAVDAAETDTATANRINAEIPEMIAAAAQEQGVKYIHCSTDYVFDGRSGAPYAETAEPHPINAYGVSKHKGEIAAHRHGAHIVRLQWIFDNRGKNFFLTMKKLLAEKPEIRVVADQIGSPSNAKHIAESLTLVLPKIISGALPPAIYHLAAQGHTSWHGFASAIAAATNSQTRIIPITTAEYAPPAARPGDTRLDTSTLASHGIAMPHWREGITEAMKEPHATS